MFTNTEENKNATEMYDGGEFEQENTSVSDQSEIVSTTFKGEDMWAKWTEEEREARKQELLAMA